MRLKFHFLPEVYEVLPRASAREAGLTDTIAAITPRELAYLTLRADGWDDKRMYLYWEVTPQAVFYLRKSVLKRLEVSTIEEAIQLARGRIETERDTLPLGPQGWHTGRPPRNRMLGRTEETLVRYIRCGDHALVAEQMGVVGKSVDVRLWQARQELRCDTLDEAAHKYMDMKGGRLPDYPTPLPLVQE